MAITNPTFNLKTGADSDLIVAREVTENGSTLGKIKRKDGVFRFPYLTRRTGDTLTGTTENIESNELKHGRTKSAPRKGASSSSGDINFEFSPETFDDMLEAVFRGKWKRWYSDTNSPSNKDKNVYQAGFFATKCATGKTGKKLIYDGTGTGDTEGLVHVSNNGSGFIVHELNSETNDVKYSLLRKYGGQTGEDLWQEFSHCALNTMQLSVEVNAIVTGSFGIMGTNNPKLFDDDELYYEMEGRLADVADSDKLNNKGTWTASTVYAVGDVVLEPTSKTLYKCVTAHTSTAAFAADNWKKLDSYEFVSSIPDKATDTMQFTSREGFLYINGKQIEFAQSLSFSLDNGLSQKFAIFVPNAISTTPLSLDITGDLSTYLVGGKSAAKELFNNAVGDKTVEILFCFQDKLEDPAALYIFQIFNAKHTENTVNGNSEDTYDESLPWSSFNEQACRVFRLMLPRVTGIDAQEVVTEDGTATGNPNQIALLPNVELAESDNLTGITITATLDGVDNTTAMAFETPTLVTDKDDPNYGLIVAKFTSVAQTAEEQVVGVTVSWGENEYSKSFRVPKS
mgnify:CR=1 FL=1